MTQTLPNAKIMLHLDPHTLYSLDELAALLPGKMTMATFMDRLGLRDRRVFRDALWGWEVLDAARRAGSFSAIPTTAAAAAVVDLMRPRKVAGGRGRSGRGGGVKGGELARLRDPLRRLTAEDVD